LPRQFVNCSHRLHDPLIDVTAHFPRPLIESPDVVGQRDALLNGHIACRKTFGLVQHVVDQVEKASHRRTDIGVFQFANQRLDLAVDRLLRLTVGNVGVGYPQTFLEKTVRFLDDGVDFDTQPHEEVSMARSRCGGGLHLFAHIAGHIGIGDVVAADLQAELLRVERVVRDLQGAEQVTSVDCPETRLAAARAIASSTVRPDS